MLGAGLNEVKVRETNTAVLRYKAPALERSGLGTSQPPTAGWIHLACGTTAWDVCVWMRSAYRANVLNLAKAAERIYIRLGLLAAALVFTTWSQAA